MHVCVCKHITPSCAYTSLRVCVCVEGCVCVCKHVTPNCSHKLLSSDVCVRVCVCVCVYAEEGADPGDVQAAAEEHWPVHAVHQHQDHPLRAQPAVTPHQPLPD